MIVLPTLVLYALTFSAALARAGHWSLTGSSSRHARHPPKRLLVVGATGGTGRQLLAQALEQGYAVTALVRNPPKLQVAHERLTVMQGDVLDYSTVQAAVRGQDAILCALGHKPYFYPTSILSGGTRNLLRAMEAHGVPCLVCESSLGIGNSAGRLGLLFTVLVIPLILPFYFWDKARQERMIAASTIDWVIVRPGVLTNRAKQGALRHGPQVGSFVRTVNIARADVAAFMLAQLTDDTYLGTAPGVSW